jgi:hypothetical protein
MTEFKEFPVGTFVMRFYKTDHVWTCTVTEDMLDEAIKIAKPLSEEYIEAEWARCPPTSWWKGDPTCGGITENYGLGKAQEK